MLFFGLERHSVCALRARICVGSPAWIRTKVYAMVLSLMSYEPWFAIGGRTPEQLFEPRFTARNQVLCALIANQDTVTA